ncbi:hypothetical protein ACHAQH_006043 [Verticillium albo-atrum]
MLHNPSKLALMALFGAASAEETIVSLIMPVFSPNFVAASVVDVGDDATTFALACHSQVPQTECGISDPVQLVAGPSTMAFTATLYEDDDEEDATALPMTVTAQCVIDTGANDATCTQYQVQSTISYSESTVLSDISQFLAPLTVTAGAEKLTGQPADTTSPATLPTETGTSNGASATPNESSSESSAAAESASTATGEAATTTDDGNAAFPRMTQNAVLAGVAAVVGGAMML